MQTPCRLWSCTHHVNNNLGLRHAIRGKTKLVWLQAGGYGKVITHVIIGLKTVKGTKQLKLDPTIYDSLQKEKVLPGDVIYIEANSGMLLFSQSRRRHCISTTHKPWLE